MPYHYEVDVRLPAPWEKGPNWVKGDTVYAIAFHRLELIRSGRGEDNRRIYSFIQLPDQQLKQVKKCVLHALGFSVLTKHLL
jgi:mRNA interferase MazF